MPEMLLVLAGNPQDINAFMDRMGLSGAGAFGAPAAPGGGAPPVADPEAAYASQLEQLQVCLPQILLELGWYCQRRCLASSHRRCHRQLCKWPKNSMMEVGLLSDTKTHVVLQLSLSGYEWHRDSRHAIHPYLCRAWASMTGKPISWHSRQQAAM